MEITLENKSKLKTLVIVKDPSGKKMQFEYNPEQLIEEVRIRPGLWDFDSSDYRNKQSRHKLWQEIVDALVKAQTDDSGGDGRRLSKSDRRELELQLQKRWKSFRDIYVKYHTGKLKTKRPYIYRSQLSFLESTINSTKHRLMNKSNQEASSDSDSERRRKINFKSRSSLEITKREALSDDDDDDDNTHNDDNTFEIFCNEQGNMGTIQASNNEFEFASVDKSDTSCDPDQMFLLSLVPHFKAIPQHVLLDVKLEIIQILKKYKNKS